MGEAEKFRRQRFCDDALIRQRNQPSPSPTQGRAGMHPKGKTRRKNLALDRLAKRSETAFCARHDILLVTRCGECRLVLLTAFCQERSMPLRRADRLFDILRILRAAKQPVTAASIGDELEVTVRTVYRDIATLQARRIPIEGAAGIGYVLHRGFELPPLMFTEDEAEAIAVGVRMLARTGDPGLQKAAESVLSKVTLVVPDPLREYLSTTPVYVSKSGAPVPALRDLPTTIRHAIRDGRKMRIAYQDENGRATLRVIQPFAVAYYVGATLVCAWCELRNDIRHFRTDRVVSADVLDEGFAIPEPVIAAWLAERQDQ
jgi:predicted DNA-binding transcriptional regulator YafY